MVLFLKRERTKVDRAKVALKQMKNKRIKLEREFVYDDHLKDCKFEPEYQNAQPPSELQLRIN